MQDKDSLDDLFAEARADLDVQFVLNRESKPFLKSPVIREAESVLALPISAWIPDNGRKERQAVDLGRPSATRGGPFAKSFARLAEHLKNNTAAHPAGGANDVQ